MPIVLGVVSAIGMTGALVGEGLVDVVAWLALTVPVAVCLWAVGRRG